MLQKKYRLKKSSAFNATYKLNNILSDDNVYIYYGKEKTDSSVPTKFAFVVSKKISKSAVKRNRIKRLMRESIRLMLKSQTTYNINKYISVICIAKKSSLEADLNSIYSSLNSLISKF